MREMVDSVRSIVQPLVGGAQRRRGTAGADVAWTRSRPGVPGHRAMQVVPGHRAVRARMGGPNAMRGRPVERVCFQLQVRPERLDEYVERHRAVRPTMLRAIAAAGRRNYSLFLREDGLLIGYYETDDDAAAARALAADPVAAAWEAEAAGFFVSLPGARPDQGAPRLPEVFHLEDAIAALDG